MRKLIAILALALAAPMAAAANPVSTQPLAEGEVLLEIGAIGTVTSHADLATFSIGVMMEGASEAEVRGKAEDRIRRITAAARSAGVAAGDIEPDPVTVSSWATMSPEQRIVAQATADLRAATEVVAAPPNESPAMAPAAQSQPPQASASSTIVIRLRDPARAQALLDGLRSIDESVVTDPVYSLTDPRRPRAEARLQALAQARARAETYAAQLGMRVVRIVRITERGGLDLMGLMMADPSLMRGLANGGERNGPEIVTMVPIGVDFALAPR